jgi:hypothetical protein
MIYVSPRLKHLKESGCQWFVLQLLLMLDIDIIQIETTVYFALHTA